MMAVSREEVVWAYRCFFGRDPESEAAIAANIQAHHDFASMRRSFLLSDETRIITSEWKRATGRYEKHYKDDRPTILIQSFHPTATAALIRDFKKIGMRVLSPDRNWFFNWYSPNDGLGSELISYEDYLDLPSGGRILVACKLQEQDMKRLAVRHGDRLVLNVGQHYSYYEDDLSDVLICPDIITYENYPSRLAHKLLYFPRPILSARPIKNLNASHADKTLCTYINKPMAWAVGAAALDDFSKVYPFQVKRFGDEAKDGLLGHAECADWMVRSFFTVHFKEQESYGLSCLESMMLGTPIVTLKKFMGNKTLGRFFLNAENSIMVDTVEEAAERVASISFEEYASMSQCGISIVDELTSDANTIERLRTAIFD